MMRDTNRALINDPGALAQVIGMELVNMGKVRLARKRETVVKMGDGEKAEIRRANGQTASQTLGYRPPVLSVLSLCSFQLNSLS